MTIHILRPSKTDEAYRSIEVTELPFVRDRKHGRRFWDVVPTGRYADDCLIGTRYALEALAYIRATQRPWILTWIIFDMPRSDKHRTGIEVGFIYTIGRALL